jgi:hypothetical protein
MDLFEIDEFAVISKIPKEAITGEIINSVRNLGEKEHLEPFLSKIIGHPDSTPHGPMEIVDIYTTHVHVRGKSITAGFILKGQGLQKVTSKKISYQYNKVPQNGLIPLVILACVGEIYDDARRDFYEIMKNKGSKALIMDAFDLSRLFISSNLICKDCGTPFSDTGICTKGHYRLDSITLNFSVCEEPFYEIVKTEYSNFANVIRKSLIINVDPHYTNQTIRIIIDNIFTKELTDEHLDVIWLFFSLNFTDITYHNYICKATWVNSKLPEIMAPKHHPESFGKYSYELLWFKDYTEKRDIFSNMQGNKKELLDIIDSISTKIIILGDRLIALIENNELGLMDIDLFKSEFKEKSNNIQSLIDFYHSKNIIHRECAEYQQKFSELICSIENIVLISSEEGQKRWCGVQGKFLVKQQIDEFRKSIDALKYERKKIK